MNARTLLASFDSIYVLALSAWVGSLLFVSFVVTPLVSRIFEAADGNRFLREFLPRSYLWAAVSAAIALPAYLGGPLTFPEYRSPVVGVASLATIAGTLAMLYAANSLVPALIAARTADPADRTAARRLEHRLTWLNGLTLALGITLLIAFAGRSAPRTSGIQELPPRERARYDAEVGRAIEELEAERGLREPGPAPRPRRSLSDEEIRELRDYYDRGFRPASSTGTARGLPK